MKIIGWIREGDKAACGGNVLEGDQHFIIRGRPISFEGARMACSKNCVIAEGVRRFTLSNGRSRVIHGMKTTGGCPMISTLNDIDGMHNELGETVPLSFAIDQDGNWTGDTFAEQTGKRFLMKNSETGAPLAKRKFVARVGDARHEGLTDANGFAYVDAKDGELVELHLIFEAPSGPLPSEGA